MRNHRGARADTRLPGLEAKTQLDRPLIQVQRGRTRILEWWLLVGHLKGYYPTIILTDGL